MRSTTLLSVTALASTALAQPFSFGHNHHARHHHARRAAAAVEKRDIVTDWITEWVTETVTEYIDMTSTVVINTATTPGQFFEGSSTPSAAPTPKPAPSSQAASAPPPPAPTPQAPSPSTSPGQQPASSPTPATPKVQQAPEPAPTTAPLSTSSSAPVAPQASAPAAASAASAPAAAVAAVAPSSSSSESSSGAMSFTGQVTHYTVGLGACGFDDAGKDNSDYIVAISSALMHGSNGDPMCNKKVNLSYGGKSISATIRDKCPSCSQDQIDLSEKAFKDLVGDLGIGRQGGVKWTIS
ncbi:hypothetical protein PpBr36_00857 [Pyricularia pennisetigena]|uniref:hypothetical protein n=1 Tax=Pyricularia pennisetigena TaxID=1578925 RepID=UPI0011519F9C|nr:hypothetical protein PpBr36_00857 [Pyricularia pennisetigena]TLS29674.1 hypothetical protein PpBr36_00857 [Pyricularia pennisetigena]